MQVKPLMSTAYNTQTDGQTERTNHVQEYYRRTFVNYAQNDWYQLLPLAEHPYHNSATNMHTMTRIFGNYGFHQQTEWINEREACNPWVTMYAHLMQDIHRRVKQTLQNARESNKTYCDKKGTEQPSIEVGDLVMLNAKNMRTKQPLNKLSPKLSGLFQVLRIKGRWAYHWEILPWWKVYPVFHVSSLEPYPSLNRPNRENHHEIQKTSRET